MSLTKSQITKIALLMLKPRCKDVWRNNNIAVPGRTFIGRLGVPDITGFTHAGLYVGCEVKTENDNLRPEQAIFLNNLSQVGGIALIAHESKSGNVVLENWIGRNV